MKWSAGVLLALWLPCATSAAVNRWTSHGPYGGEVSALVVDPTNPSILYAGTERGGVFKSTDAGATWFPASLGLATHVTAVAIDPMHPTTVYFSSLGDSRHGSRDYRSDDGGANWKRIGSIVTSSFLELPTTVTSMAVDPRASDVLYATYAGTPYHTGPASVAIRKSTDGGLTWQTVFSGQGYASHLLVDAADSNLVYALITGDVYRSSDAGQNWTDVFSPGKTASGLSQAMASPYTLYVSSSLRGIFRSVDQGSTWAPSNLGLGSDAIQALSVLVSSADPSRVYTASYRGLSRSTDGGTTWQPAAGGNYTLLALDPADASHLYSTESSDGIRTSSDGGTTWQFTNEGLRAGLFLAVAVDPQSPSRIYAGGLDNAFISSDGGETWQATSLSLGVNDFAFDSRIPGRIVAATTDGIQLSNDRGLTWNSINGDLSVDKQTDSVAIDPASSSRIYAGGAGYGELFRTDDLGRHWTEIGPQSCSSGPALVAVDPTRTGVVYFACDELWVSADSGATWRDTGVDRVVDVEVSVVSSGMSAVYAASSGGLLLSLDHGMGWERISTIPVSSVAARPTRFDELWVFSLGRVLRSQDGGATWMPFDNGLVHGPLVEGFMRQLTWDPAEEHLYGAGIGVYELQPAAVTTLPAVASLHGAPPTYFHSDATIWNPSRVDEPTTVTATYRCMTPGCSDQARTFTIAPRALSEWDDVVVSLFGSPETAGAVELTSDQPLIVTSRLYTPARPSPTFGMLVPGLGPEQAHPMTALTSLSHSAVPSNGSRTNLGIYNPDDAAQTARVTCYDASGSAIGQLAREIGPRRLVQIDDDALFTELNVTGDVPAFACTVQGDLERSLFTYAAVIDNQSQDPTFVLGRDASLPGELSANLPAAASLHGAGETFFHSDVALFNTGDASLDVHATYRCSLGDCVPSEKTFTLGPLQVLSLEDFVGDALQAPESGGAVELSLAQQPSPETFPGLIVTSRLYTPSHPAPTVGMFVPGLSTGEATLNAVLTSLSNSSDSSSGFRTNVGAFNPADTEQRLSFYLYAPDGYSIGTVRRTLAGHAAAQINDVFREAGITELNVPNAYCLVRGDSALPFYAYASVIDNQSQDPFFVTGQPEFDVPRPLDLGTFDGIALDATTGLPLAGVGVTTLGLGLYETSSVPVQTGPDGRFQMLWLPPGPIPMLAVAEGYSPLFFTAPLAPGKNRLEVGMQPCSPCLAP